MAELLNLFLSNTASETAYKSKQINITHNYPERQNPVQHGERLLLEYANAKGIRLASYTTEQVAAIKAKEGCYFDISGLKGKELLVKSLEAVTSGIRICNVQSEGDKEEKEIIATVYIPNSKEHIFLKKLQEYAKGIQNDKSKPAHDSLVRSIEKIQASVVRSLWTDKEELFPIDAPVWCEIWLRVYKDNADSIKANFFKLCEVLNIPTKEDCLLFPDRIICVVCASEQDLTALLQYCGDLAEFRRMVELNAFFLELETHAQKEWVDELLSRLEVDPSDVAICILDTGVNSEHPLLKPLYEIDSVHKAREYMISGSDHNGHGTQMAGIAGYGDLKERLTQNIPVVIKHSLESVKLISSQKNDPELYGEYTKQAISMAEIAHPHKRRAVCLAITAEPTEEKRKTGRPSSWSAAIDALASGAEDGIKRLVLISAGNVQLCEYNEDKVKYPDAGLLHQIEDPAQSWNALTVGACTFKMDIDSPYHSGYKPVASAGGLSPYSATSRIWESKWPIKPEILCEGGNAAISEDGFVDSCDNLSVLTTYHRPTQKLFVTTNATSAATANASWIAAQLMKRYPNCWPETVRALMVASAQWPDGMFKMFCEDPHRKRDVQALLRSCGYGIASLERAEHCAENMVNMVMEAELQPFEIRNNYCGFAQMHLHELPWPKDYLLAMDATDVQLKVVLSYFIEPGPGEIGFNDKYRYPSCGLRFDVNKVGETREQFERRINQQMNDDQNEASIDSIDNDTNRWLIGEKGRTTGSLHCDIWNGTAAELSESNLIAIYPTSGWWRTRRYLKRQDSKVRYSLVATLSTPQLEAKLYTQIVNKIGISVKIGYI